MDLDGDGVSARQTSTPDNGHANKPEVPDKWEAYGYNTSITNADTDGDGCDDWVEIHDLDGNRKVDANDQLLIAKRFAGKIAPDPVSDKIFDVDKERHYQHQRRCSGVQEHLRSEAVGWLPGLPA